MARSRAFSNIYAAAGLLRLCWKRQIGLLQGMLHFATMLSRTVVASRKHVKMHALNRRQSSGADGGAEFERG